MPARALRYVHTVLNTKSKGKSWMVHTNCFSHSEWSADCEECGRLRIFTRDYAKKLIARQRSRGQADALYIVVHESSPRIEGGYLTRVIKYQGFSEPKKYFFSLFERGSKLPRPSQCPSSVVHSQSENICAECFTTETPQWRKSLDGVLCLCNKCALREKKSRKRK